MSLLQVLDAIEAAELDPVGTFEAHILVGVRDYARALASSNEKPIAEWSDEEIISYARSRSQK